MFGSLDALERKHKTFEQSRARDDADADRRLINATPSEEETETVGQAFKRPPTFSGKLCEKNKLISQKLEQVSKLPVSFLGLFRKKTN